MAVIEHEAKRQVEVIEGGGTIAQETRLYDPDKNVTRSLRSKEDAHDYRYFPDPDLLPLELDEAFLDECRASLPELPDAKRKRYEALGITPYNASVLTAEVETARWFDALLDAGAEPKQAANWVVAELFGALNRLGKRSRTSPVSPAAGRRAAQARRRRHDLAAPSPSRCSRSCSRPARAPATIVEERGLKQTSDTGAIDAEIDKILAANADKVAQYKAGKEAAVRLLRRPDDEGDGRQGQPAAGQRAAAGEAGLSRHPGKAGAQAALRAVLRAELDPGLRRGTRQLSCVSSSLPQPRLARIASRRAAAAPPKLLVVISVDQFSADLFDEYRPQFTRRPCAARWRHRVPQRLPKPRRDRDLPRPFDDPDRRPSSRTGIIANIWFDQSVAARRTRASIAPRTRACPAPARSPTTSRPSICWCRRSAS